MADKLIITAEGIFETHFTQEELLLIEQQKQQAFEQSKTSKIQFLSIQCQDTIINKFIATNGHQYRLELEDQLNMQGQKSELDDDITIANVAWRTMDSGYINHTREEWLKVYSDAFQHKKTQLFKLDGLRTQVLNSTTQEELDSIVW